MSEMNWTSDLNKAKFNLNKAKFNHIKMKLVQMELKETMVRYEYC